MKKIEKWIAWAIAGCFALILLLLSMDWMSKYVLYLGQRDALYELIKSGATETDQLKEIVSYLQGTASRRLGDIERLSITFGVVFFMACFYLKTIKRGEEQ